MPHVHKQNGLVKSLIKRLQLITRLLLMKSKFPSSAWAYAILHAASLIRLRPTAYHKYSPMQLVAGHEPNISHLKIFGCVLYMPIAPPQRKKRVHKEEWKYMSVLNLHQSFNTLNH